MPLRLTQEQVALTKRGAKPNVQRSLDAFIFDMQTTRSFSFTRGQTQHQGTKRYTYATETEVFT